jgi:hypothetical protein
MAFRNIAARGAVIREHDSARLANDDGELRVGRELVKLHLWAQRDLGMDTREYQRATYRE